jgi:hypothetical protein
MNYPAFLGIDLTSTEAKPSACLGLDSESQLIYFGFFKDKLGRIIPCLNSCLDTSDHKLYDAAVAAHTDLLHHQNRVDA